MSSRSRFFFLEVSRKRFSSPGTVDDELLCQQSFSGLHSLLFALPFSASMEGNAGLTQPIFTHRIPKSILVVFPGSVEVDCAILSSLKDLAEKQH